MHTPQRERSYWLSRPLYETQLLALWRPDNPPGLDGLHSLAALEGLRIGGIRGYSYSQLGSAIQERMVRAPNYAALLQMLRARRVDLILVNEAVRQGHAMLGVSGFSDEADLRMRPVPGHQPSRFHLLFSRQHPEGARLHAEFDATLGELERGGELARLRQRWISPSAWQP